MLRYWIENVRYKNNYTIKNNFIYSAASLHKDLRFRQFILYFKIECILEDNVLLKTKQPVMYEKKMYIIKNKNI